MPAPRNPDTRDRLLVAAAELIAASPGQDVPLRAICDRVGVKLPTLYHFFGSKQGLLDAVIEHGFERYLAVKAGSEHTDDPIDDIRQGWDAHVAFGIANPGFYALMYGQVTPGRQPAAQARASAMLLDLTLTASAQGRLVVTAQRAAEHVLAANVGVTLRQIVTAEPDPALSVDVREAAVAAITGTPAVRHAPGARPSARRSLGAVATDLLDHLGARHDALGGPETVLLRKWLTALAQTSPDD